MQWSEEQAVLLCRRGGSGALRVEGEGRNWTEKGHRVRAAYKQACTQWVLLMSHMQQQQVLHCIAGMLVVCLHCNAMQWIAQKWRVVERCN